MKFQHEILVDTDRQTVWNAFDDPTTLEKWVQNLVDYRLISGQVRLIGAVAELIYREKDREIKVTETTTERRAPDFNATLRETEHSATLMVNTFEAVGAQQTRWSAWGNVRFSGMRKWASLLLIKEARTRLENDMQCFKLWVETAEVADQ